MALIIVPAYTIPIADEEGTDRLTPSRYSTPLVYDGILDVEFGGLGGATTSDLTEGARLYYTNERVDDRVSALVQNGTGINWTYDDTAGTLTGNVGALTVSQFVSAAVSQWTNDAGYLTSISGLDHGSLDGLGDDDHTQYHTDARALTWLGTRTTSDLQEGSRLYYTDERVDDRVAALVQNGTGLAWTYVDGSGTLTGNVSLSAFTTANLSESGNLYYTDERVDDRVALLIQNGTGITWSYNDGAGTFTPTVTITQYTDEMAQDAVGTILTDSSTIDFTYNDGAGTITADVLYNSTNLKITSSQLNTIQDIATSSSVQFGKLGVGNATGANYIAVLKGTSATGLGVTIGTTSGTATLYITRDSAATSGSNPYVYIQNTADTGLTSASIPLFRTSASSTRTWNTGNILNQREAHFDQPTWDFAASSTTTNASNICSLGAPIPGANAIFTNSSGVVIESGSALNSGGGSVTNGYALTCFAPTGATNNRAARFVGSVYVNGSVSGGLLLTTAATTAFIATISLAAQTSNNTTLTIPNFAGVSDTFTFNTLAQTLSNKTLSAADLGTPTAGVLTNCTGLPVGALTGILPVASGGTGTGTASLTALNNITGLSIAGTTGTTSTNIVFSATPTFTGTVTTASLTAVGTANINASGSAVTTIGTGGTGAVNIGNATGNTAFTGAVTIPNTGLKLLDTAANNTVTLKINEDQAADRILNIVLGASDRTITLSGNPTLADWFDQSVKVAATPQFARLGLGAAADATAPLNVVTSSGNVCGIFSIANGTTVLTNSDNVIQLFNTNSTNNNTATVVYRNSAGGLAAAVQAVFVNHNVSASCTGTLNFITSSAGTRVNSLALTNTLATFNGGIAANASSTITAASGTALTLDQGTGDAILSLKGGNSTPTNIQKFSIRTAQAGGTYINTQASERLIFGVDTGSSAGSTTDQMSLYSNGNLKMGSSARINDTVLPIQLDAVGGGEVWYAVNKAGNYGLLMGYTASKAVIRQVNASDNLELWTGNTTIAAQFNSSGRPFFPAHTTTASAANTFLDSSTGQLLRNSSSERYKRDIEPLDMSYARRILELKPIWYRSKSEFDNQEWSWYGFSAEDNATIDPRLTTWAYMPEDMIVNDNGQSVPREGAELVPDGVPYAMITVGLVALAQDFETRLRDVERKLMIN